MITDQILKLVKQIWTGVQNTSKKVANIPASLLSAARKRSAEVVEVAETAAKVTTKGKESLIGALHFFSDWIDEYQDWNSKKFRKDLSGFIIDIFQLPAEATRVLVDVEFSVPGTLARKIIDRAPDPMMYGLYLGLETLPGWQNMGGQILAAARQIPSISDLEDEACRRALEHEDLHTVVERADQLTALLIPTLELAIRHLPRDLSIDVSVLGEGGGTQVAGHPAKLPLEWAKWALELADRMMKKYLAFYSACAATARAKQEAAWKLEVMAQLERIEKEVQAAA